MRPRGIKDFILRGECFGKILVILPSDDARVRLMANDKRCLVLNNQTSLKIGPCGEKKSALWNISSLDGIHYTLQWDKSQCLESHTGGKLAFAKCNSESNQLWKLDPLPKTGTAAPGKPEIAPPPGKREIAPPPGKRKIAPPPGKREIAPVSGTGNTFIDPRAAAGKPEISPVSGTGNTFIDPLSAPGKPEIAPVSGTGKT